MANTATTLLNQAKVRAGWPTSGGYLSDAEVLSLADDEMLTTMAALLRRAREEFWVTQAPDVPVSASSPDVRVPSRALGSALRDVLVVSGGNVWNAPEIAPEEAFRYRSAADGSWRSPFAFYCEGSYLKLLPTPTNGNYSIRLKYYRRPSELIEGSTTAGSVTTWRVGEIASIADNVVTLKDDIPASFTTDEAYDIVDGLSPHDSASDDLSLSSFDTVAKTMTFSDSMASRVKKGDYVTLSGESPVVQLPDALFPLLILATVRSMHVSSNDTASAGLAEQLLARKSAAVLPLIEPRVIGERPVVINRNSALRGGGRRGW